MNYVIRGAQVVTLKKIVKADMLLREGKIAKIGKIASAQDAEVVNAAGLLALPGFVDLHTHGGCMFDTTEGMYDPAKGAFDNSEASFKRGIPLVMRSFGRHGVTRTLLAMVATSDANMAWCLSQLADYVECPINGIEGAKLEGINIEGTFLMRPERAGGQNPKNFRAPAPRMFDRFQRAARGHIRYVDLAPEYGKAAEDFARYLTKQGVLVGAGHSACAADQVKRCRKAGLKIAVHLMNGAIGTSFKPFQGGNTLEAFLRTPELYAELICDGYHVAPPYVVDAIARKGLDRIVLVTDALFLNDAGGVKEFTVGGRQGEVAGNGQYLQIKGDQQTLFGSLLHMDRAFANVLNWLTVGMDGVWAKHKAMPVADALVGISRAASTNPAMLIGLGRKTGSLAVGKCADVILAKLTGKPGKFKLDVKGTFVGGVKVVQ